MFVFFKALLLHGSLPEDEQDVSLSLDQGNAEQQVVVIVSPFVFSFFFLTLSVCSLTLSLFCVTVFFVLAHQLLVFSSDHISFS